MPPAEADARNFLIVCPSQIREIAIFNAHLLKGSGGWSTKRRGGRFVEKYIQKRFLFWGQQSHSRASMFCLFAGVCLLDLVPGPVIRILHAGTHGRVIALQRSASSLGHKRSPG